MKRLLLFCSCFVFAILFAGVCRAHFLWLDVDNYSPKKGDTVTISIGWGHSFPHSIQAQEAVLESIKVFMISPTGKKTALPFEVKDGKPLPIKFRVKDNGVYVVVAIAKNFGAKTTEGWFYKTREELKGKEILYAKWICNTAMALISVGGKQELPEISIPESNFYFVPLANPSLLKEGDLFKVKLLFKGKPLRNWVYATYAGFSDLKETFAWATRTDKEGIAQIKILKRKGPWLVKSEYQTHYPDPKKADYASYKCTLTFGF